MITFNPTELAWTFGLMAASIVLPALLAHTPNNQWITGTLVNACLFLAAWRLPVGNALPVAIFPSSFALMRGLLPVAMAPLLPVIMLANVVLIGIARHLRGQKLGGMIGASMVKYLILAGASLLIFASADQPLLVIFQIPQLITALAGGLLALGIIKLISLKSTNPKP